MGLVRAYVTAAWLSSLNKENDPTPIWTAIFRPSHPSKYTVFHGPIAFLLSVCPPPLTTAPHYCHRHHYHHHHYHSPRVWQSHSRPCVCWRCYIMPSFHCTPDQREQSSREKLLLANFSSLPPSHCFISTQRLYSRLHFYPLPHSSSCWKPNRANWEWSEVSL